MGRAVRALGTVTAGTKLSRHPVLRVIYLVLNLLGAFHMRWKPSHVTSQHVFYFVAKECHESGLVACVLRASTLLYTVID
jgi:hypothetical protein